MTRVLVAVALAGCATSEAKVPDAARVELAAVTLGDDCHPPAPPRTPARPAQPGVVRPPADCATAGCGGRPCDQTSMQLAISLPAGAQATTIRIERVELLDARGKVVLERLIARMPTRWEAGKYVTWNERATGGDSLQVMYELTAPNWDKLTNGRWNAHAKTFQLRVTVAIGTANKTVEKQSITPARLPPPVPT